MILARKRKKKKNLFWPICLVAVGLIGLGFEGRFYIPKYIRPPEGITPKTVKMKTTAYCHCRKCCSYKWFAFIPYQKTGPFTFRRKHVGVTSSGALARPGTIAADTSLYPYGTIMHIRGYGYARVEDTGGAIKGQHIDLYHPNHWIARAWGVRHKKVRVWMPPKSNSAPSRQSVRQASSAGQLETSAVAKADPVPPPDTNSVAPTEMPDLAPNAAPQAPE